MTKSLLHDLARAGKNGLTFSEKDQKIEDVRKEVRRLRQMGNNIRELPVSSGKHSSVAGKHVKFILED